MSVAELDADIAFLPSAAPGHLVGGVRPRLLLATRQFLAAAGRSAMPQRKSGFSATYHEERRGCRQNASRCTINLRPVFSARQGGDETKLPTS
jgi:hypothetical protein